MTPAEPVESPALLELARQGDSDAFCELCRLYQTRLLRQAMALCGHSESAEDLAQDAFVAAWKSIRCYDGKCRFFTWLCSILIHLHKSKLRDKRPLAQVMGTNPDGPNFDELLNNLADGAGCPAEALALSERASLLRQCLARLPEKHREVVYLRFYVDESLEGIATTLDCSPGTVKSRLFHALEKLRHMKSLTVNFPEKETCL